ncbi:hypothetical protein [uncultured Dubosiella sp.]|uniref:hypothetical protein n=1 Tax=uncultured Dubosiella sp. TaxID=1937011 RepID=UPI0027313005|nr:hypothetical protein [uncultured Dubosiella sp.]
MDGTKKLVTTNPMIVEARAEIAATIKARSEAIFDKNYKRAEDLTRSLKRQRTELHTAIRNLKASGWE